jgi:hypothetical protein
VFEQINSSIFITSYFIKRTIVLSSIAVLTLSGCQTFNSGIPPIGELQKQTTSLPSITFSPTKSIPNSIPIQKSPTFASTSLAKTEIASSLTLTPTDIGLLTETPPPNLNGANIVDHTTLPKFGSIPLSNLQAAAAIKTLFMHQSTGDNIDYLGLKCLAGLHPDDKDFPQECLDYALHPYSPFDDRNWKWQMWNEPMADAIAKTDQWISIVKAQQQNYQVLGMKFCYVDGWNQDFNYYKSKMEALEKAYPQKTFIWATEVLWAKSDLDSSSTNLASATNIQNFNQQLRSYAITNKKVLYDLADIESHDSDGNFCQSNGVEAMCEENYAGIGGGGGGHPGMTGSIRLAKGFWLLMARLGGWKPN